MTFWEVRRIIRGYRRRHRLTHQLLAECVFAGMYAMRDPQGKTPKDMFPELFEDDDEYSGPAISEDEVSELQDMMRSLNS